MNFRVILLFFGTLACVPVTGRIFAQSEAERIARAEAELNKILDSRDKSRGGTQFAYQKSEKPSLKDRIQEIDSKSVSFKWVLFFGSKNTVTLEAVNSSEREQVLRLLKADETETASLDLLFKERKDKNAIAREIFQGNDLRERDIELILRGFPVTSSNYANLPEPNEVALVKMLREYEQIEKKNETDWLEKLEETIDPTQFSKLAERWGAMRTTYFTVKFLALTEQQVEEIDAACLEFKKVLERLKKNGQSLRSISDSADFLESRFLPFSKLTPRQFKLASIWLPEWTGTHSFEGRLSKIAQDNSLKSKSEEKVLGGLYEEGVVWEKQQP